MRRQERSTEELAEWLSSEVSSTFVPGDNNVGIYACCSHMIGEFKVYGWQSDVGRHFQYHTDNPDYLLSLDRGNGTKISFESASYLIQKNSAAFVRLDQVREFTIQPMSVAEGFVFPADFVQRSIANYFDCVVPSGFKFLPEMDLTQSSNSGLIDLIRAFRDMCLTSDAYVSPVAIARFEELLSSLIVENFRHNFSDSKSSSYSHSITPAHVKRAVDFAKAHARHPITSNDMASAAGISLRSLQDNFQKFLETTPVEYLRRIRFEGVRRELLSSPPNSKVINIARSWGFIHMGRFSIEYRNKFGVSPAQDLRKEEI